jgi:tetratricopeptide (TPR) repeat protein
MKRPQWIVLSTALALTVFIFLFARTVPSKNSNIVSANTVHSSADDDHEAVTIDTILALAKKQLTPEQVVRINMLENSVSRGAVKDQQLHVYHQLAGFWADSARIFEPYAWYRAQAARLENSEKSLTFAARLFLENLIQDEVDSRKKWKALQAKDLFERSLKLNPANDSAKIGLGAAYLFGNISASPMEGIIKIREVVEKDSNNVYGQLMLAKASILSGQYEKAVSRLETVTRIKPRDLESLLLLADVYERMGDKKNAVSWYEKGLPLAENAELRSAIADRIAELKK